MDMTTKALPTESEMREAFFSRDADYEGIFYTAVKTTGIFCRPTCTAKKPRPENIRFFPNPKDALHAGFRPCRRCRPLEPAGATPPWLRALLKEMEADPSRRWRDEDLRERGVNPARVRRWFQENHDMTFHAYSRALRLGAALGQIQHGGSVIDAAFETGYDSLRGFNEAFRRLLGSNPFPDLARKIRQPSAVRAVARANGDNRLAILIPCHRVIGSDGDLTGYGGGIWRKKKLLELEERAVLRPQLGAAIPPPGQNRNLGSSSSGRGPGIQRARARSRRKP